MYIMDMIVLVNVMLIIVGALAALILVPIWMLFKVRKFVKEEEQEILNREGAI